LLRGMVVTPDQAFAGEVLIAGDTITCVAASCAAALGAATATVVDTHGILVPGLIDTHNHILFDIFDETDWTPLKAYGDHNQWTSEPRYSALVNAKQYLNGESGSPVDDGCELDKYGEIKGLVAGTTSIVGAANPTNRACYGSLARTIDQSPNGLPTDAVQVATLFPNASSADGVCTNFASGKTDAYVIHVAEGVDASALAEFASLGTVTTTDDCLYAPKTAIVHGVALGDAELTTMAQAGMSLVWSPRSNVFLYGGGTNLSATANVPLALAKGINVALAPDWSIGGSQNLLDELRFADQVDNTLWGDQLSPKLLVQMVTTHAAKVLGLSNIIGALAPGMKADLMVIGGDPCAPYDAVLAATPADVRLVVVGGVPLYGDPALRSLGPATPGCEDLTVCTSAKFICVAAPSTAPTDKLGETLVDIQATLSSALTAYDALGLSLWTFSPITPLVRCPP
jgi:cytosine/adenosine deaminase-related metal-dependent hydrolase